MSVIDTRICVLLETTAVCRHQTPLHLIFT